MLSAKITSKGQITIPVEVRKKLGLQEGSYVTFTECDGGIVMANASTYSRQGVRPEFSGALVAAEGCAVYDASQTASLDDVLANLSEEQRGSLINALLGKSFVDELDEWRRDFDVVDDGVSKILNRKSRELPNIKKVSKIWG